MVGAGARVDSHCPGRCLSKFRGRTRGCHVDRLDALDAHTRLQETCQRIVDLKSLEGIEGLAFVATVQMDASSVVLDHAGNQAHRSPQIVVSWIRNIEQFGAGERILR